MSLLSKRLLRRLSSKQNSEEQSGKFGANTSQSLHAGSNLKIDVSDLITRASQVSNPKTRHPGSSDAREIQSDLNREFEPGAPDLENLKDDVLEDDILEDGELEDNELEDGGLEEAGEVVEHIVESADDEDQITQVEHTDGPDSAIDVEKTDVAGAQDGFLAVRAKTAAPSTDVQMPRKRVEERSGPDLTKMVRKEVVAGGIAIGLFFLFLFGWSAVAPLSSAAIAPGVISPHGSRKTVQHLEGGIIDRILVEEGSQVEAGSPLILLEDTMARASYDLIRTQYFTFAARHARLLALQNDNEVVYYPDWLVEEAGDPNVASILATEVNLLETRKLAHADRKAVLQQRIGQLEKEIEGVQAQIDGQTRQLELIAKEISGVQQLVNKGLERTPRLLGLQRDEAQIRGLKGSNIALIAKTEQAISETELELIAADTVLLDEVAREIASVQADLSAAGEKMAASGDILNRVEILAPVTGKVIGLKYHTAGGIIAPGSAVMDIVPENEELIIEARVSPLDIDVVYETLEAQIHLSSFSQRNIPMIEGRVRHVSADRLLDEITGEPYFLATVEIKPSEVAKIGKNATLTPGMPAEVMIVTGQKTLLGYLFQPVVETLRHAFREG